MSICFFCGSWEILWLAPDNIEGSFIISRADVLNRVRKPLPPGFEHVALGKKEKAKVEAAGGTVE